MGDIQITFEGIRGFYDAHQPIESHPVIQGFSPPEFFGRSPGPLDHRVDVFGVGMVFYYLLAGTPPPTGARTAHMPFLPVRAFRFDLPPGLQSFIDGCTAQNPADRFGDLDEAREALDAAYDVFRSRELAPGTRSRVSLFCAVDSHIGIGKGRRSPINQDAVLLAHDPGRGVALVSVADGVSTASFGSGDIASSLLNHAASETWSQLDELLAAHPDPMIPKARFTVSVDEPRTLDQSTPAEGGALPEDPDATGEWDAPAELVAATRDGNPDDPDTTGEWDAPPPQADEAPEAQEDEAEPQEDASDEDEVEVEEPRDPTAREIIAEALGGEDAPEDLIEALTQTFENHGLIEGGQVTDRRTLMRALQELQGMLPQGRTSLVGPRTASKRLETPAGELLRTLLEKGNDAISDHINERFAPFSGPVHEVMGTTALTALIQGDQFTLASLGDSRAYLLRDGHMECLTRDHNLATMRIIEGFPADECLALPQGSALARCLGTFEVTNGNLKAVAPEPDMCSFRLLPGDTLLLTTDGLLDFAGPTPAAAERNIKAILETEEVPSMACLRLILLANEGGGEDNIGMAIIRVIEHHPLQRAGIFQAFPPVPALRDGRR